MTINRTEVAGGMVTAGLVSAYIGNVGLSDFVHTAIENDVHDGLEVSKRFMGVESEINTIGLFILALGLISAAATLSYAGHRRSGPYQP